MQIEQAPHSGKAPWVWLSLQILGVALFLALRGNFTVEHVKDSPDYLNFPWDSTTAIFGHFRTPAYPAFLEISKLLESDNRAVPACQFLIYAGSVLIFFHGLRRLTGENAAALIAASSFLYANILHGYVATIATDTLAASCGVAAMGLLAWMLAGGGTAVKASLAVVVMLSWLIRPAYLFLPAAVVLIGMFLVIRRHGLFHRELLRSGTCLIALTFGPLLGYSLLRLVLVGHMGIVSFGGYSLVGITGQLLDPSIAATLSPEVRPIAETALIHRDQIVAEAGWSGESPLNYARLEAMYNPVLWDVFLPAAKSVYGDDHQRINDAMKEIAEQTLRHRPKDYAIYLVKASRQAVKKILWDIANNPAYLLLILVGAAIWFLTLVLGIPGTPSQNIAVTGIMSVIYTITSLACVIPACPPIGRMTDASGVFIPVVLASIIWRIGADLRRRKVAAH
ncbi:MAG: hypothetical protein ACKVT0_19470 [Planctomycetaceae bacterium]